MARPAMPGSLPPQPNLPPASTPPVPHMLDSQRSSPGTQRARAPSGPLQHPPVPSAIPQMPSTEASQSSPGAPRTRAPSGPPSHPGVPYPAMPPSAMPSPAMPSLSSPSLDPLRSSPGAPPAASSPGLHASSQLPPTQRGVGPLRPSARMQMPAVAASPPSYRRFWIAVAALIAVCVALGIAAGLIST
jgi:hypothetical protein